MRNIRVLLIVVCAVLLTACGGNTPAATNPPPADGATAVPPTSAPPAAPTERAFETGQPPLPIPGTLVAAATEDPEAGQPYQLVLLERSGGIAGKTLVMQITDGQVTQDGVAVAVAADDVTAVFTLLDQVGFFGLQGTFTSAGAGADLYTYRLTAERNGASRTIVAQDGFTPPDLQRLMDSILRLGQG
jgi:hypothetical protein